MRLNGILLFFITLFMSPTWVLAQEEDVIDFENEIEQSEILPTENESDEAESKEVQSNGDLSTQSTPEAASQPKTIVSEPVVVDSVEEGESSQEPLREATRPKSRSIVIATPQTDPSGFRFSPVADVNDGPDLDYEARLHDIYIKFLSSQTSAQEWSQVAGGRQTEVYRIQKGDTLWDISQTLFGDGYYWPKIWSLNSSITNPHIIQPGHIIRFALGDESGPPSFTVSQDGASAYQESSFTSDEPSLPPPVKKTVPVARSIPPSFPQYQDPVFQQDQYDDVGIEYGRRPIADLIDQVPLPTFVVDAPLDFMGTIVEIENGFEMASNFEPLFVRMKKGVGEVGQKFLVVRDRGPLTVDRRVVKSSTKARGVDVLGEIQLTELTASEKKSGDGEVYRALVLRSVSPITNGSTLIAGQIQYVNLTEQGPRSSIEAQIIGGQFASDRKLFSPQSFVFLNKGRQAGLNAGQILPIRLNRKARDRSSRILSQSKVIGWLKVVDTQPLSSTAVILRSWDGVLTGDLTGFDGATALSSDAVLNKQDTSSDSSKFDDEEILE